MNDYARCSLSFVSRYFGALLLFCNSTHLVAQEQVSTEEDLYQKLEDAIFQKLDAVRTTIEEEATAKRLSSKEESSALSEINFSLSLGEPRDVSAVIFFAKHEERTRNARLENAWAEFDAAVEAWNGFMRNKLPKAIESRLIEAANIWRRAKSPIELSSVIDSLRGLQRIVEGPIDSPAVENANRLREAIDYFVRFKDLLAGEESGDVELVARASNALAETDRAFCDQLSLKEMEERRNAPLRKFRVDAAALGKEAVDALPKAKSPEELSPLVDKLTRAALIEETVTGRYEGKWDEGLEEQMRLAREWRRMAELESSGALKEAAELAGILKERATQIAPTLVTVLDQRAEALTRAEREATNKRKAALESDLSAQLAGLKDAQAALALVASLRSAAGERLLQSPDGSPLTEALRELEQIGRAWQAIEAQSGASISVLNQVVAPTVHPWRIQFAGLRDRIRRAFVSVQLARPELLASPLDSVPLTVALQKLTLESINRSDWQDVYDFLEMRMRLGEGETREDLAAIRAFIAGQNFEKAQLFGDAVAAYKTVLRSVGRHSPIEAAGARLKVLGAEHPELFTTPPK